MADDRLKSAIEMVAWRVITNVADLYLDGYDEVWEEFPGIGECDIARVVEKVHEILARPATEAQQAAYEFLASRAET